MSLMATHNAKLTNGCVTIFVRGANGGMTSSIDNSPKRKNMLSLGPQPYSSLVFQELGFASAPHGNLTK